MAVHLATVADYLRRTVGLLSPLTDSTVACWMRADTLPTGVQYQTPFAVLDDPAIYSTWATTFVTSTGIGLDVDGTTTGFAGPAAGTWYHLAWVQAGTTQRFYVAGALTGSVTHDRSTDVVGYTLAGNDTLSVGDIDIAYYREWTVALTATELVRERDSATAYRLANLATDTPLVSDLLDLSGNAHTWTQVGAGSFVAGPSLPGVAVARQWGGQSIRVGPSPAYLAIPSGAD